MQPMLLLMDKKGNPFVWCWTAVRNCLSFFASFTASSKETQIPVFPSVLSLPVSESVLLCFITTPSFVTFSFPQRPKELQEQHLTPSTPGRTNCHSEERKKQNTCSRQTFVCLLPCEIKLVCVLADSCPSCWVRLNPRNDASP